MHGNFAISIAPVQELGGGRPGNILLGYDNNLDRGPGGYLSNQVPPAGEVGDPGRSLYSPPENRRSAFFRVSFERENQPARLSG